MKVPMIEIKHYQLKPYLKAIIYNLKKYDTWKIQLTMQKILFLP